MLQRISAHRLYGSVLLLFLAYAAFYIWRTTFVVEGVRYFSLFEDAMISLRYGRNLIEGHGLVYNPGERPPIEGYTNFLWVVILGVLQLLPLPEHLICVTVQLLATACLSVNLWFVYRLAQALSGGCRFVTVTALLLTSFYLPLNTWSLQGMEVSLITTVLTGVCWSIVSRAAQPETLTKKVFPWLGLLLLVRPDMVLPYVLIWGYLLWRFPDQRKAFLLTGTVVLVVLVGALTVFRKVYFGDLVPSTYYLKMTGYPTLRRVIRGVLVYLDFVEYLNVVFFVLPFAALLIKPLRRDAGLLLLLFGFQSLYSMYVGGDAWEELGGANRYYCIAMPGFFVLLALMLERVLDTILGWGELPALVKNALLVAVGLGSVLMVNALKGKDALRPFLKVRPLYVELNEGIVKGSLDVRAVSKPGASVAVVSAGAPGFYLHRTVLDILGKCDKTVAHLPMRPKPGLRGFHPGHMKWDYSYSIGQLKPDVVLQVWPRGGTEAFPFLEKDYVVWEGHNLLGGAIFFRKDSPQLDWERLGATRPVTPSDIPTYKE